MVRFLRTIKSRAFLHLTFFIVFGMLLFSVSGYCDVLYDDVPSYNQSYLPGKCSETSIAMVMGWYDTNKYITNWKRFVPYGGNSQYENPLGVYDLTSQIVDELATGGNGMSNPEWYDAEDNFPALASHRDSGANFSLDYIDWGNIITWGDIKNWLDSYYVGDFGTWSNIEYYENDGTYSSVDDHDMASIGYHENYNKFSTTSN